MRTSTRRPVLAVCALVPGLVLTACAGGSGGSPEPSTPAATTPAAEPSTPAPADPGVATDVTTEDLLPATAWDPPGGPREESAGVVEWRLPESCAVGAPEGAVAMRTASHGDGAEEAQVGVQQVAVLPDPDAAVAEADRIAAALDACTATDGSETTYVREDLPVGAQGTGLATAYSADAAADPAALDGALGSYLALTRRGTAITLVALEGGESTVGAAREDVTALVQQAWELLCRFDAAGCSTS